MSAVSLGSTTRETSDLNLCLYTLIKNEVFLSADGERGEKSSAPCPLPVRPLPDLGRSFHWRPTCAESNAVSHGGIASPPELGACATKLSHPIGLALWGDSAGTPLEDRNTPGCCQRPRPKYQWDLSEYCVLVQTGKKNQGFIHLQVSLFAGKEGLFLMKWTQLDERCRNT